MRYHIEARGSHLHCMVSERETAQEMREFLVAVQAACRRHACPRILMSVRSSRAIFKPEDYGLGGYAQALVSPECRIALLGDSPELQVAHEYIELVARQRGIDARAFRDEAAALAWLRGGIEPGPAPRPGERR